MFIRYISHEIRNPLNTVTLGLESLEEDMVLSGDPAHRLESIREIKASCDMALLTLNDVLTAEKIRSGFYILDKKLCNISDCILSNVVPFQSQVRMSTVFLLQLEYYYYI